MQGEERTQFYKEKSDIINYSRLLYDRYLVSAAGGNVSFRCGDQILITGSNVSLRNVTIDGLLLCDRNGNVIEGNPNLRPSKETAFHLAIYELKPEVNCVIHVHPNYAVTWSLTGRELPLYTESARLKLKEVPIIPDARPGSKELAALVKQTVAKSLDDITVFLMEAHGIISFGKTMEESFYQVELLEDTAKIAVLNHLMKS